MNASRFNNFLDKLKTSSNSSLVESIRKGFSAIYESQSAQLTLYRGQSKPVKKFSVSDNMASSLGKGIYMTDSVELAKAYTDKYLYKASVTLNNPFVMDWRSDEGRDKSVVDGEEMGLEIKPGNWIVGSGDAITNTLSQNGFDGVVVKQPSTDNFPEHLEVVIFNPSNIEIEDVKDLQGLMEATDYHSSDTAEAFLNKYGISEDDMHYMGSGDFGTAYSVGDGKVLKITSSKSEAQFANELMQGNYGRLANVYAVALIDGSYFILQEELEEDSDIENLWYEMSDAIESQGLPVQYISNFDEDEYIEQGGDISEELRDFMNELEDVVRDYRRLGIERSDIRPENLGRDSQGNLKAFDIDERR